METCEICGKDFEADQDYIICPDCRDMLREPTKHGYYTKLAVDLFLKLIDTF